MNLGEGRKTHLNSFKNHSKHLPYFKDVIHGFQNQGSTLVISLRKDQPMLRKK